DEKGYQEVCDRIIRDADSVVDPLSACFFSRALSASASETIDRAAAIRLAKRAVAADRKVAWYWFELGAAQYPAGKHDEAIRSLKESLNVNPAWLGRGKNYVILAMACHKLDQHDEARAWLAKVKPALVVLEQTIGKQKYGFADSNYRGDWFELQIL